MQNIIKLPAREPTRVRLTPKRIADAHPREKRYRIADEDVAGLFLVVQPTGSKSFVVRGRIGGGRTRPVIDVRIGTTNLHEARAAAKTIIGKLHAGIDPRQRQSDETSTSDVIDAYLEYHRRRDTATVGKIERCLRRASRRVGAQPFDTVTSGQWAEAIARTYKSNGLVPARDDAKWLRSMTRWALKQGLVTNRVAIDIEGPTPSNAELAQSRKHTQWTLRRDDWPRFWGATSATKNAIYRDFLRILALTGLRRREASLARWRDIDLEGGVWTIPPENAKSARQHTVYLGALSQQILAEMPKGGPDQLVFPSRTGGPMIGWTGLARPVAAALGHPLQLHGLRRGYRTALAELRVDRDIAEMMIAHAVPGLEARYNKADLAAERREAQELLEAAWQEALR